MAVSRARSHRRVALTDAHPPTDSSHLKQDTPEMQTFGYPDPLGKCVRDIKRECVKKQGKWVVPDGPFAGEPCVESKIVCDAPADGAGVCEDLARTAAEGGTPGIPDGFGDGATAIDFFRNWFGFGIEQILIDGSAIEKDVSITVRGPGGGGKRGKGRGRGRG